MKTIFRYTNLGLLLAAMMALGAVASVAQDPCADADGQTKMQEEFDKLYADKVNLDVRSQAISSGKSFLEKYGSCEPTKDRSDWLKVNIPKMETKLANDRAAREKDALLKRFDRAMDAKNWDEVYASGKEILGKHGEEFRVVVLVLGSIGYDELLDRQNGKYNDETLRFAKQALADLEAGKVFKPGYGVKAFTYKSKDDAIAWMNLTIGSINQIGLKDKKAALPYLYKATLATGSDVAKNPNPYEFIGLYYFDELNKLVDQIKTEADGQKDTDTPEVAQQKVDKIKALVALSNGTAERAIDAFSRAYTLGQAPAYKAKMKKNVEDAYKVRFSKTDGLDAWISSTVAKPFVNPMTPITPISDPEPVVAPIGQGAGVGAANGTGLGTPSGTNLGTPSGNGVSKPAGSTTTTTKPATTPVKAASPIKPVTKRQSSVKKPVVKKKVG